MAGLYVHVPFCHSKCAYCDFYSTVRGNQPFTSFASAVLKEYALRKDEVTETFQTLYFGGGTPSILPTELLGSLGCAFSASAMDEATLEANPEDVSAESLQNWREAGFNRLSMGVQSFRQDELEKIRRRHSVADANAAISAIQDSPFAKNFSLDLIYGLPGQTLKSWEESLNRLFAVRPQHFSAYMLGYEEGTLLWKWLEQGLVHQASDALMLEMYALLCERAYANGYEHYEISNFALPGYRAKHNSAYWDSTPYLGLGPSAHSFDGLIRRYNPSKLSEYLDFLSKSLSPAIIDEENDNNRFNDLLITRLRTSDGLALETIAQSRRTQLLADAAPLLQSGHLLLEDGLLRIPESKWPVSNTILENLIQL